MNNLQKEFESTTGYASCINSDLYPDGKIYTKEYTEWLEKRIESLTNPKPLKVYRGDLDLGARMYPNSDLNILQDDE